MTPNRSYRQEADDYIQIRHESNMALAWLTLIGTMFINLFLITLAVGIGRLALTLWYYPHT